ncbi:uncharacterized protein LOC133481762 isoform X4 [Phyllopteryx taeniolatus]|uniref:uncharacterized protein LOC133481762 isoform X4 n=1 Tax=Phyllopteryx taeniolatus TaxID=161469 RepID=UPI002AD34DBB|nr:uncharacterized protein LOC133481762 isoform X4 [Phyllopteryx taeniolatus]
MFSAVRYVRVIIPNAIISFGLLCDPGGDVSVLVAPEDALPSRPLRGRLRLLAGRRRHGGRRPAGGTRPGLRLQRPAGRRPGAAQRRPLRSVQRVAGVRRQEPKPPGVPRHAGTLRDHHKHRANVRMHVVVAHVCWLQVGRAQTRGRACVRSQVGPGAAANFRHPVELASGLMPVVVKESSAAAVNLSMLTADVFAIFCGIFIFRYSVSPGEEEHRSGPSRPRSAVTSQVCTWCRWWPSSSVSSPSTPYPRPRAPSAPHPCQRKVATTTHPNRKWRRDRRKWSRGTALMLLSALDCETSKMFWDFILFFPQFWKA